MSNCLSTSIKIFNAFIHILSPSPTLKTKINYNLHKALGLGEGKHATKF